jgi:hypothetical protein
MHRRTLSQRRLRGALGLVVASLILFAFGPATASGADEAAWLFEPDLVAEIELGGLSQEELEKLETEKDEYQAGTFELKVGGVVQGPPLGEVGIRLKGSLGSYRPLSEKAAFKVKFNEYVKQKFFGLKKLTLNNMVQDPSMLHETQAYELFRLLGVPAPRTGYANVLVNGVNYGLHLNLETYDDVSLSHLFASTGHLYEADEPGLDVAIGNQVKFEIDEGDEEDLTDLEALITAANDGAGDWSDGMAGFADLEEMTRMWAVERYIGHWDGYAGVQAPFRPNNYYLHSLESGEFSMLPWGTDQTWGLDVEFDEPAGGVLFNRCFEDVDCAALYVDALRDVLASIAVLELDSQASCLAELLAPWQAMEDEERREFNAEQIAEGGEGAEDFIANRPDELSAWLATQPGEGGVSAGEGPAPCQPPEAEWTVIESGGSVPVAIASTSTEHGLVFNSPSGDNPDRIVQLMRLGAIARLVKTLLHIDQPGRVTETATMQTRNGARQVCSTRVQINTPGSLVLRCYLSRAARRHLRAHGLRLSITIRFVPQTGEAETIRRKVTVPRLQR